MSLDSVLTKQDSLEVEDVFITAIYVNCVYDTLSFKNKLGQIYIYQG